jgi:hypothetical protein
MGRYADAVTQILLEQGRARAQGQLASGQAWGQAAQQLGQIPGQVIAQQQQLQEFQQKRDLNAQAIESNKALEAQRRADIATKQRAAKNQETLDQLYGNAFVQDPESGAFTFKRDLVEQGLAQSGQAHLLPGIMKDLEAMDTAAQAGAGKRRTTVAQALHNITTQGFTNESALTNLAYLKQNHLIPEDRYQAMLDQLAQDGSPEGVKALVTRVGGAIPEYQQLVNAEAERVAKAKKLEAETAALAPKPIEVSAGGTVYNPVTKTVEYTAPPKAPEPTQSMREWEEAKAQGYTGTLEQYRMMDANRHRPVSITNAANDTAMITQAAKNILANPRDLTSIKTITSLRGDQRLQLFNTIKSLDPQFNVGNIDRQIKFLDSYEDPKGRAATNRGAMNNILQHAADLSSVNEQYRRSNIRLVNTSIAAIAKQGGTEWQQFATPLAVLKDEIALYFAGGYAPSADQAKTWDRIANDTATPAQIEQFAKDIIHVGLRRADTHNEQFKTMMGYDDPNLITPQAVAAGQRLGLGDAVKKYGSGGTLGATPATPPPPTAPPPARGIIRARDPQGVLHEAQVGTPLPPGWRVEP